eukprot:g56501.t1
MITNKFSHLFNYLFLYSLVLYFIFIKGPLSAAGSKGSWLIRMGALFPKDKNGRTYKLRNGPPIKNTINVFKLPPDAYNYVYYCLVSGYYDKGGDAAPENDVETLADRR